MKVVIIPLVRKRIINNIKAEMIPKIIEAVAPKDQYKAMHPNVRTRATIIITNVKIIAKTILKAIFSNQIIKTSFRFFLNKL